MSDPTEVKLDIEHRLNIEQDSVAWLSSKIKQSTELTSTMTGILTSFEERLTKLEATILPVYQETENLQRRQENIDKTMEALDHVIGFYNVSKQVEPTVRAGPAAAKSLDDFLQTMSRLRGSLDYFEKSNSQSIELENIKALYIMGGDSLNREFGELLKKHSVPQMPEDLLNTSSSSIQLDEAETSSTQNFPDDIQSSLNSIAEWLNANDRDEFLNVYAAVRGQCVKKSLDLVREKARCSSLGRSSSPTNLRQYSSPIVANEPTPAATPTSTKKRTLINKKISSVATRFEAASRRSLGTPSTPTEKTSNVLEGEVNALTIVLSALYTLMSNEQGMMVGIIPHRYRKKIFEIITRDSLDMVVRDAEIVVSKVKRANANDSAAVISMFQLVRHVEALKPSMDRTLEGADVGVRTKYGRLTGSFGSACANALEGFVDGIRADATTRDKMPRDGTVFQLTSNVILYLEQLQDYATTLSSVLKSQSTAYTQAVNQLPTKISVHDHDRTLVGIYVKKVLVQLNLTLVNKSDSYSDQFLKAVFRLNNNDYILRSLQRSGLLATVLLAKPDCEYIYNEMIREQKMLYSQSWARVLGHICSTTDNDIPNAVLQFRLTDKYCRMIKDKFDGFNAEFGDLVATQRRYSVPEVELRESLKRDNKEYICPIYFRFYEKYASVPFTKYPEKYVKYTPDEVSAHIDNLFDTAA